MAWGWSRIQHFPPTRPPARPTADSSRANLRWWAHCFVGMLLLMLLLCVSSFLSLDCMKKTKKKDLTMYIFPDQVFFFLNRVEKERFQITRPVSLLLRGAWQYWILVFYPTWNNDPHNEWTVHFRSGYITRPTDRLWYNWHVLQHIL